MGSGVLWVFLRCSSSIKGVMIMEGRLKFKVLIHMYLASGSDRAVMLSSTLYPQGSVRLTIGP